MPCQCHDVSFRDNSINDNINGLFLVYSVRHKIRDLTLFLLLKGMTQRKKVINVQTNPEKLIGDKCTHTKG